MPAWPLVASYVALMLIGFYAVWIEPFWIRVTHFTIPARVDSPLRVAHISDLHTKGLRLREKRMVRLLAEEKPDVILVTGDSIIDSSNYQQVASVLRELRAPLGVWLVRGNWENAMPIAPFSGGQSEAEFYRQNGVTLLLNRGVLLRRDIWIFGLDEVTRGKPNLDEALAGAPDGAYRIGLIHVPSYFDRLAGRADLVLAGHCHGGQIRLPGMGPFYLPAGCGKYVAGWYERSGSRLYVTRGLGNTLLDMRFFSRPELAIFDLVPERK